MSYRPLCDVWFLARAKLKGGQKYYGAYLGGFPERARALLGCRLDQPVLHICGGMARLYPYRRGFGPVDKTLDLDPACKPDFESHVQREEERDGHHEPARRVFAAHVLGDIDRARCRAAQHEDRGQHTGQRGDHVGDVRVATGRQ